MSYFFLPPICNIIHTKNIQLQTNDNNDNNVIINKSLYIYLTEIKKQIDNVQISWDIYKKYTNTYEYIHTIIPNTKTSICKLKPLSRSFYKLIEICNLLHILEELGEKPIQSFHLAEGPGGFIEAIEYLRCNNLDKYYGMTLIDKNDNIPGWKKSKYFLLKHKNVIIENGSDELGDLFNVENLWHCYKKYKNSMNFITGDGGFDFSIDFNKQESLSIKLVFCQICYAIAMQKKGGIFILKVFDIFTQGSIDLIYILDSLYESITIIKPCTSRFANSERYVVCKKFKIEDSFDLISSFSKFFPLINDRKLIIERFINISIPSYYINKLEDINAIIGQQQLENILSTLSLLDNNNKLDKLDNIKKNNIQRCIQWCNKYKLPYNKNIQLINIFI